jgi:hypothetical protein
MEMGPIKSNTPKRRSDPPPMTTARTIMEYGTKPFTDKPFFKTFAA